jgi:transcriptional regulator with XRE-family HTH domain
MSYHAAMPASDFSDLLRTARLRAGLTQRELARRARTAQSVVARIESATTSPSWRTAQRLLRAAGFELHVELRPLSRQKSHMLDDVRRILRLSPEDRLLELRNAARFVHEAKPLI